MYRYIGLNFIRNMKKNTLISLITAFLILFLISYENTLKKTSENLEYIYDTTTVTASFIPTQKGVPMYMHYNLVKQILDIGFVVSYNVLDYITGFSVNPQVYFLIGIPEPDYPKLIGLTSQALE